MSKFINESLKKKSRIIDQVSCSFFSSSFFRIHVNLKKKFPYAFETKTFFPLVNIALTAEFISDGT